MSKNKEGKIPMKTYTKNSNETMEPISLRAQPLEELDNPTKLTPIRLHELKNAWARNDSEATARVELELAGVFLMIGYTPRTAIERMGWILERIDACAPESLVPGWPRDMPKDLPMFQLMVQLMNQWRQLLGYQHLHGSNVGVSAKRLELLGALLACGLPIEAAVHQVRYLEDAVTVSRGEAECDASKRIQHAIYHVLEQ